MDNLLKTVTEKWESPAECDGQGPRIYGWRLREQGLLSLNRKIRGKVLAACNHKKGS